MLPPTSHKVWLTFHYIYLPLIYKTPNILSVILRSSMPLSCILKLKIKFLMTYNFWWMCWCLQTVSGIGGFFLPLKYIISASVIFIDFNFSCFNLGIGFLLNEGLPYGCVLIVARLCVSFNPFCEWMWASKLSDTTWIRLTIEVPRLSNHFRQLLIFCTS